jgi:uncharacterized protein (DUF4415 family)
MPDQENKPRGYSIKKSPSGLVQMIVTERQYTPRTREEAIALAKACADAMTPEEDAALVKAALDDPNTVLVTEEFTKGRPGRPVTEAPKIPVSIRLSPDVLDHFRSGGRGWQGRIDEALRKFMQHETGLGQPDTASRRKKRA